MHIVAIIFVIAFMFVYYGSWNGLLAITVLGAIGFGIFYGMVHMTNRPPTYQSRHSNLPATKNNGGLSLRVFHKVIR